MQDEQKPSEGTQVKKALSVSSHQYITEFEQLYSRVADVIVKG
jgi:hypothetical protein